MTDAARRSWTFGKTVAIRPSVSWLPGRVEQVYQVQRFQLSNWGPVGTVEQLSHKRGTQPKHQRYYMILQAVISNY